jgi:hypothetical protein
MKKLEIEKTKPTFIISVLKVGYYVVLVSLISNFFNDKTSLANKWMSFSSSNLALVYRSFSFYYWASKLDLIVIFFFKLTIFWESSNWLLKISLFANWKLFCIYMILFISRWVVKDKIEGHYVGLRRSLGKYL